MHARLQDKQTQTQTSWSWLALGKYMLAMSKVNMGADCQMMK